MRRVANFKSATSLSTVVLVVNTREMLRRKKGRCGEDGGKTQGAKLNKMQAKMRRKRPRHVDLDRMQKQKQSVASSVALEIDPDRSRINVSHAESAHQRWLQGS